MKSIFEVKYFNRITSSAFIFFLLFSLRAEAQTRLRYAFNPLNTPQGGEVRVNDIAVDNSGNRYVTGYLKRSANANPGGSEAQYLRSRGSRDIFIAKYNPSGAFMWAHSFGEANDDEGKAVSVDAAGNVLVAGYFNFAAGVDFDPSAGTALLSSTSTAAFFAKYDTDGNYVWAKKIDASGQQVVTDMALDAGSNIYVTGTFQNTTDFDPGSGTTTMTATTSDMFFAKYTSTGDFVFAKGLHGNGTSDDPKSIFVDGSSNIYIAGGFRDSTDFDPSASSFKLLSVSTTNNDLFFAKYDPNGALVFVKTIGSSVNEEVSCIRVSPSGSIFITGSFGSTLDFDPSAGVSLLSTPNSNPDVFVARYTPSGGYLWAFKIGNTGVDQGLALELDDSTNVYVTGFFDGTADFNPSAVTTNLAGSYDMFLAKYDSNSTYRWAFKLGASGGSSTAVDRGTCLAMEASTNIHVGGTFLGTVDFNPSAVTNTLQNPNATNHDSLSNGFLAKYSSNGGFIHAGSIGGISTFAPNETQSYHVVDASGNTYLAGNFTIPIDLDPESGTSFPSTNSFNDNEIFLAKYNSSGSLLWAKSVGGIGADQVFAVCLDSSGNVCITGSFRGSADFDPSGATANLNSAGSEDVFVAKYSASGTFVWAKRIGGTGSDVATVLHIDNDDNIVISGTFSGTADFDPNTPVFNLTSAGGSDLFLAKYTTNGTFLWAGRIGGTGSADEGNSICTDNLGNIYVGGNFSGTNIDFDFGAASTTLSSPNSASDGFFAKYNYAGALQWVRQITGTSDDRVLALSRDRNGNLIVAGDFTGTTDLDPGTNTVNYTATTPATNAFFGKYDNSGNYIWAYSLGVNTTYESATNVVCDENNFIYLAGTFSGGSPTGSTVDIDPKTGVHNLSSHGANDVFVAKYSTNADLVWSQGLGGTKDDFVNALSLDAFTNFFISGAFLSGPFEDDSVDFDPRNEYTKNLSAEQSDVYLAKYSQQYTITPTPSTGSSVLAYGIYPGAISVSSGEDVPFTITPPTNHCLVDVLVDGTSIGRQSSYTFTGIHADHTIEAVFEPNVSFTTCPGITTRYSDTNSCGTNVSYNVAATHAIGYGFVIWNISTSTFEYGEGTNLISPTTWLNGTGSGSFLPVGNYHVRIAAYGLCDTTTCGFSLSVVDTIAPVPSSPSLNTVVGQCSASVEIPTASDNCTGIVNGVTSDPLIYSEQGTYTIHWTFSDDNGNSSTQNQTVIVADTTAPQPVSDTLSAVIGECSVSVTVPTAIDNCAGLITGTTTDPLTYSEQGNYVVHWTYDDGNGNTSSQIQSVIIDDVTYPTPTLESLEVIHSECGITVSAPTATDNCSGLIQATTNYPVTFSVEGEYSIVWQYDDGNGNTSVQQQFVIINDQTPPVPSIAVLDTIRAECSVSLTKPTAVDNCVGLLDALVISSNPITFSSQGTHVVEWLYDDGNGNTISQNQVVVIDDTTAPVPTSTALTHINAECSFEFLGLPPTAIDNCVGTVYATTSDPTIFTEQGNYTIQWNYNDGNGNTASQVQNVTIHDVTPPVPVQSDLPWITGECSVTVTPPLAYDNCNGTIIATTEDPLTYSGIGQDTVHWSYDDGNGNISYQTQIVLVYDVSAPIPSISTLPVVNGQCSVTLLPPSANDMCVGNISGTTSDATEYNAQGVYTVHWSFDDGHGNISFQNQTVVVDDTTSPLPSQSVLSAVHAQCTVTLSAPTATDNCVGLIYATTTDSLNYSTEGSYTVHWLYDDGNGNTCLQEQQVIIDDTTAPVPLSATLATLSNECSVSLSAPTASDNCAGMILATTSDPLTYTTEGTHTVHWIYNDGNGNSTTQNQTIIINDTTAPVVTDFVLIEGQCSVSTDVPYAYDNCAGYVAGTTTDPLTYNTPGHYTIHWIFDDNHGNLSEGYEHLQVADTEAPTPVNDSLDLVEAECHVSLIAPTAEDNCSGIVTATTSDATEYSSQGTYVVHWTFSDESGNHSFQNQTVVIDDHTAPIPSTTSLATVYGECSATLTPPTASDNCSGIVNATTSNPTSYTSPGSYTVTWHYNDGNGNSSSQTQSVIVHDNTPPTAVCKNIALNLSGSSITLSASQVDDGSDDNCGIATRTVSPSTFTSSNIGANTVIFTATDATGNTATCSCIVTIYGTTTCSVSITSVPTNNVFTGGNPNILYLGYGPQSTVLSTSVTGGASHTYSWSPGAGLSSASVASPTFTPTTPGMYTFTVTVTDNNGCTSTKSETICVLDVRVSGQPTKVYLCHGGNTMQLNTNAVAAHITNHSSDKLGSCSQQCGSGGYKEFSETIDTVNHDPVEIQPNPFSQGFTLVAHGDPHERFELRVFDVRGNLVDSVRDLTPNIGWSLGFAYPSGFYYLHVIQGSQRTVLKLLKVD